MRDGFYGIAVAPADRPEDGGVGILAHFKDNRIVGVDQGGCRLSGSYRMDGDDRIAIHMIYSFKAGSELITGETITTDTDITADLLLGPGAARGEPQTVDIGLGPMTIRLNWLADPV